MFVAIGMPGPTEWIIILVIVLIFFGVGKLPAVLGQMGKGVKAFKDGVNEANKEDKDDPKEIDVTPTSKEAVSDAEEVRSAR
ncbi:MAG: twin-arginine translocase TatA/TatE family subunit [Alphaproteobacteria bacterium]|nr:twin-arginine translocase TatA/TatE family subunit [Alphaproteobacteria bacterium]